MARLVDREKLAELAAGKVRLETVPNLLRGGPPVSLLHHPTEDAMVLRVVLTGPELYASGAFKETT